MKRIAFILLNICLSVNICLSQENGKYGEWILADTMNVVTEGVSTLLNNGKILVAGNNLTCELYDYSNDAWEITDSLRHRRTGHILVGLSDGKALVMGGKDVLANEIYDDSTEEWSTRAFFKTGQRYDGKAILLLDGKALYTGGIIEGSTTSSCELYDPFIDE
jgi:WD40 repeat protein